MTSAFGIEHIAKYSGAYGVNRVAIAAMEKDRQRRIKKIKAAKKDKSAFDVDHAIAKSFTRNGVRLAQAAEKGNAYAAQRLGQGLHGANYAANTGKIQAGLQTKGMGGAARKARSGAKRLASEQPDLKASGQEAAVGTRKMRTQIARGQRKANKASGTTGIGRMESQAASAIHTNQAAAAKPASMGWKAPTALAGAGAVAGGGYAYSQRRKTA